MSSDPIQFTRDPFREIQTQAVLLRLAGGSLHFKMLEGMLYMADRCSLALTGSTITYAPFFNGDKAPSVGISIHQLFDSGLRKYIDLNQAGHLELLEDPGDDELSDYDVETLAFVYNEYSNFSIEEFEEMRRSLPEWKESFDRRFFEDEEEPILFEDILRFESWSEDDIQHLRDRLAAVQVFDHLRRKTT